MSTAEKRIERQVQLWNLPGPAAVLLTVTIVQLTAPFDWFIFPFIAFVGLIATFFRGMTGVGVCILILFASSLFQLAGNEYQYALWTIGGSISLALAWIATALSQEEVESILQKQPRDSVEPAPVIIETKFVEKIIEKTVVDEAGLKKAQDQISELEALNLKVKEELTHAIEEIQALQKQGEQYPLAMKKQQTEQAQILAVVRKDLDDALRENADLEQRLKVEKQSRQDDLDAKHAELQELQRKESGIELLRIELDKSRRSKEQALYDLKQEMESTLKQKEDEIKNLQEVSEQLKSRLDSQEKKYQDSESLIQKNEKQIEALKSELLTSNFRKVEEITSIRREKDKEIEVQRKEKELELEALKADNANLEKLCTVKDQEKEALAIKKSLEIESLKKDKMTELRKLSNAKDQELETLLKNKNSEIEELRNKKNSEIEVSEKSKISEIDALTQKKNSEIEALIKEKDSEIAALKTEKSSEINRLINEKDLLINALRKEKDVEIDALRKNKMTEIEALIKEKDSEIERLKAEKDSEIANLRKEKEELASKEDAVVWGDSTTKEGRELSKVQGMYQQLRDQYEEKSKTLDGTRYELFHTKEKLEVLQKANDEDNLYDRPSAILGFEQHIKKLENEIHRLEQENIALERLVTAAFTHSK